MNTAATVVLSIIGFIAFFYLNLYAGSFRMRRAATKFMRLLREQRYEEAHALLSTPFRSEVPQESFQTFLASCGVYDIKEFKRWLGDFHIGSNQGAMMPYLIRNDGVYFKVTFSMFREGMRWTVASIDAELRLTPAPMPMTHQDPPQGSAPASKRREPGLH